MSVDPGLRSVASHVLIVDDDPLLRGMAVKSLLHAGFAVSEAANGEDALARAANGGFDLILLDVIMPGLDGYEVCRRIRASGQGARVPILMLTGLNDTASIELAYAHGATDFITKPINWTLLTHKVRYALRASSAAEAMRRGQESLARAQVMANMGNWTLFENGRMESSAELSRLLGIEAAPDGLNSPEVFLNFAIPQDRAVVGSARARLLHDGTPYQLEYQIERQDGAFRTLFEQAAPILDAQGRRTSVEGITQDVTERTRAREQIQQLASYDSITGLPNRQFFTELAVPSLERASRNGTGCAVLHIDIDRFKEVNEAFGRKAGDGVLKTVAERLRTWTHSSDLAAVRADGVVHGILASGGGNTFTLLVTDVAGQAQATVVAQRLLAAIAAPIMMGTQSLVLSASIGVAFFPEDAADFPQLAHCAEQALYAAKRVGRGQHRFFDEQMNLHAASSLRLETEFRRAIGHDELRLYFQPKIDASTGAVVGAEALVRWQHPERGLVMPDTFITMAEHTGLILPMTDWVLHCACGTLRRWADAGEVRIPLSVNIAAPSFTGNSLVGKLDALMQRFDLAPKYLMLEMTESVLMRDIESCAKLLQTLRARGFGLSLDDFGTGYSSLSYLRRLPMDEIKIDRAFITDAARGGRDGALAAAIIALGRELGLHVVAEGVETREQSAFLLRRGCKIQQGFLFSKAVPAADFVLLLRSGARFPVEEPAPAAP